MKTLSIVIPTLNRATLIAETLDRILIEISWLPISLSGRIELIIADNASNDATQFVLAPYLVRGVRYHHFADRAQIGVSICRTIELSQAEFVWVFGDDDLMLAGTLRSVMELLLNRADCSLFYFNRLVVDWKMKHLISIPQERWPALEETIGMPEFVRRFTHWPGFITCMIFRRKIFTAGASFPFAEFEGWEFLARIYAGGSTSNVWVGYLPAVVQRLGVHSWKEHWPRYWLVNFPNMLDALERAGFTSGALAHWREHDVSPKRILIDAIVAKAFGVTRRDPFWGQASACQQGLKRAILNGVRFGLPCFLARIIYRLQPKYRD
jgi:glycosyltransferase involved in cell wall biosynthesis